jgi:hypothetical protein
MFNGTDPGDFDYVEDFGTGERRNLRGAFKEEPKNGAGGLGSLSEDGEEIVAVAGPGGGVFPPADTGQYEPSVPQRQQTGAGSWTSPQTGQQIGQILSNVFQGLTARQQAEVLKQQQQKIPPVKYSPQGSRGLLTAIPRTKYGIGVYVLAAIGAAAAAWGVYYMIKKSRSKSKKGEKK